MAHPPPVRADETSDDRGVLGPWLRLTGGTAVGEAAGLAVTGAVSAVAARAASELPPAALVALMALGGLAEGACLGLGQGLGLGRRLGAGLPRWVLATALATLAAWSLGMGGSWLEAPEAASPRSLLAMAGAWGLVVGTCLGVAQRVVWRGLGREAPGWVLGSALAWALAMSVTAAFTWAMPAGLSAAEAIPWNGAAGLVTGLVAGAVQGAIAARLLGPEPRPGDGDGGRGGDQPFAEG